MKKRIILLVLDSAGIGEMPDAGLYNDEGSNTLYNTAAFVGGLNIPNLASMGLGNIMELPGVKSSSLPLASFGKMQERSKGKDTTTGHWEIAGLILEKPFPVYPDGFPAEIIALLEERTGRKVIGNKAASGTVIIDELGAEAMQHGRLIVYTSADSVLQIAAHEAAVPLEELYDICQTARGIMQGEHGVGRIIARPFIGEPGNFQRTAYRRDFSLAPSGKTVLDAISETGRRVLGIGKIGDIFAWQGISESLKIKNNRDGLEKLLNILTAEKEEIFIFANLNDFDTLYGHRNLPEGYAACLTEFDAYLGRILPLLDGDDLLLITADHGCDPTTVSTDHSREYVPLLAYQPGKRGCSLGIRSTFSDIAATIADLWNLGPMIYGQSFRKELEECLKE